jgi:Flp pilus assembly pilin Flp
MTLQTALQTIWNSLVNLGWIKVVIAIIIIGGLTRVEKLLGLLGALLFIAYLLGWI